MRPDDPCNNLSYGRLAPQVTWVTIDPMFRIVGSPHCLRLLACTAWAALAVAGCTRGPVPRADPSDAACTLGPSNQTGAGELRVLLTDPVGPGNAPTPTNEAERLVFRQLYDGLVRLDCQGRVRPALARSWDTSDAGRVWTFTLNPEAGFWGGTGIDADAVLAAWRRTHARNRPGSERGVWTWLHPDSTRATGPHQIEVRLRRALDDAPLLFAHPSLAVAGPLDANGWPAASGAYVVSAASRSSLRLAPSRNHGGTARALSSITFLLHSGDDIRDWLTEVDMALTRESRVLDFAHAQTAFSVSDLGPTHAYVVVSPALTGAIDPSLAPSLARELITDTTGRAQALELDRMWIPADPRTRPPARQLPGETNRVVFALGDAESRRISERLSAVARARAWDDGSGAPSNDLFARVFGDANAGAPPALGLEASAWERSLATGDDRAYLVVLRRFGRGYTVPVADLLTRAPWMDPSLDVVRGVRDPEALERIRVPLLETRTALIHRRGFGPFLVDGDRTLRLHAVGESEKVLP